MRVSTRVSFATIAALGMVFWACEHPDPVAAGASTPLASQEAPTFPPDADTYLRQGNPNQNQGSETILRLQASGRNRALLRWSTQAIEQTIGGDSLASAHIELTITDNGDNWGPAGRLIELHRLTRSWTELGATWNCPTDANPANSMPDCATATWEMVGPEAELPWMQTPTASVQMTNGLAGVVILDVTADVAPMTTGGGARDGWLLKKGAENLSGQVDFGSRESPAPPRLLLTLVPRSSPGEGVIGPGGGDVVLAGAGRITFAPGAFASPRTVRVTTTTEPDVPQRFDDVASLYEAAPPLGYEVRINTGNAAPSIPVEVELDVPPSYLSTLPEGHAPQLFTQVEDGGDEEAHDNFVRIVSLPPVTDGTVRAIVPSEAFANFRTGDGSHEAIVVMASMPADEGTANAIQPCPNLGLPLERSTLVTSAFRVAPRHYGTDFRSNHDPVVAARNGTVVRVRFQRRVEQSPSTRTGLLVRGWGWHVQVHHADRCKTLYAHLDSASVTHLHEGQAIAQGDSIGRSDSTPADAITAPHLHLEYRDRNGDPFDAAPKIPPQALVDLGTGGLGSGTALGTTFGSVAYGWGAGESGQLGNGATNLTNPVPEAIPNRTFLLRRVGVWHACGIEQQVELALSGRVWCWGQGESGQLGNGGRPAVQTAMELVTTGQRFAWLSLSEGQAGGQGQFTCGITTTNARSAVLNGPAFCWGEGRLGQLGNGQFATGLEEIIHTTPVPVLGGHSFRSLSSGAKHTCGMVATGHAYCWGYEVAGELGNGNVADELEPVPDPVVGGLTFRMLDAGENHTCGITTVGQAVCWGYNPFGQVGTGNVTSNPIIPVLVVGGLQWRAVSAGMFHTCGLTEQGQAYCWGSNQYGQLGNGATSGFDPNPAPVAVLTDHRFWAIRASSHFSCALTREGEAYCWGLNDAGQLGNPSIPLGESSLVPIRVEIPPVP